MVWFTEISLASSSSSSRRNRISLSGWPETRDGHWGHASSFVVAVTLLGLALFCFGLRDDGFEGLHRRHVIDPALSPTPEYCRSGRSYGL
jgi:hypothetical protein